MNIHLFEVNFTYSNLESVLRNFISFKITYRHSPKPTRRPIKIYSQEEFKTLGI